jgi:hypothetical protein
MPEHVSIMVQHVAYAPVATCKTGLCTCCMGQINHCFFSLVRQQYCFMISCVRAIAGFNAAGLVMHVVGDAVYLH